MTPPESVAVAVELERLRGDLGKGFAEMKGSLDVLVERSDRTEKDLDQLRVDVEGDMRELRVDVERLKRAMWVAVGACLVLGGAAGAAVQNLV